MYRAVRWVRPVVARYERRRRRASAGRRARSTGSIGRQALDVLAAHADRFEVVALAAGRDERTLGAQAARAEVSGRRASTALAEGWAVAGDDLLERWPRRRRRPGARRRRAASSASGRTITSLERARSWPRPTRRPSSLAGTWSCPWRAGSPPFRLGRSSRRRAQLATADQFRALRHLAVPRRRAPRQRRRVIITGSGGPFREWPADRIESATPADALAHPTWRMGGKITVDSATLMNKALEVIEARRLYDFDDDRGGRRRSIRRASFTRWSSSPTARSRHSWAYPTCAFRSSTR